MKKDYGPHVALCVSETINRTPKKRVRHGVWREVANPMNASF